jgi:hypothetical protein
LAKAREELTSELRDELDRERNEKAKQEEIATNAVTERETASEEAQRRIAQAKKEADAKETRRLAAIDRRAGVIASTIAWVAFGLTAVLVFAGTFLASDQLLPDAVQTSLPGVVWLPVAGVALLSVLNLVFGTSLRDIALRLKKFLARNIGVLLRNLSSE